MGKFIDTYAWLILLGMGVLELGFGLSLLIQGPAGIENFNLEIVGNIWRVIASRSEEAGLLEYLARGWGQANIFAALTIIVVAAVPFRKGELWSWYFLWFVPLTLLVTTLRNWVIGVTSVVVLDGIEGAMLSVVLAPTARRFFHGN